MITRTLSAIALTLLLAACATAPGSGTQSSSSSAAASSAAMSAAMSAHPDITVDQPAPGTVVTSPLTVTGRARGPWYFEASFPVRLLDGNGNEIAITPAQAQGDWMTTDFVPFSATLVFTTNSQTGTLVLEKDNPSGEPQNADSIAIPVQF